MPKIVLLDKITVLVDKKRRKRDLYQLVDQKAQKRDLIPIGNFNVQVQKGHFKCPERFQGVPICVGIPSICGFASF